MRGIKDANYELAQEGDGLYLQPGASPARPGRRALRAHPALLFNNLVTAARGARVIETAVAKLLDGGDVADPNKRIDALAALAEERIAQAFLAVPAAVLT